MHGKRLGSGQCVCPSGASAHWSVLFFRVGHVWSFPLGGFGHVFVRPAAQVMAALVPQIQNLVFQDNELNVAKEMRKAMKGTCLTLDEYRASDRQGYS